MYLLHDDADVVRMKVVAHSKKQLDVLVADRAKSLDIRSNSLHQVITG